MQKVDKIVEVILEIYSSINVLTYLLGAQGILIMLI